MALPLPPPNAFGSQIEQGLQVALQRLMQQRQMQQQQEMQQQRLAQQKAQQDRLFGLEQQKLALAQQRANAPAGPMSTYGKLVEDIKNRFGENSEEYRKALSDFPQVAQNTAQGKQGMSLRVDPTTGAIEFQQGGQKGAMQMLNEKGELISKPTLASSTAMQKQYLSNQMREFGFDELEKQPYIGVAPSVDVAKDILIYKSLPEGPQKQMLKSKLAQFGLASKVVPEIATLGLRAAQLTGSKYNLKEMIDSYTQGWPSNYKTLANALPSDIQQEINAQHGKFQKQLSDINLQGFAKGFPIKMQEETKVSEKVAKKGRDITQVSVEELLKMRGS